MSERKRRQFSSEFKLEAVRQVSEAGKPLAQVTRELGIRPDMLRAHLLGQRVRVAGLEQEAVASDLLCQDSPPVRSHVCTRLVGAVFWLPPHGISTVQSSPGA